MQLLNDVQKQQTFPANVKPPKDHILNNALDNNIQQNCQQILMIMMIIVMMRRC